MNVSGYANKHEKITVGKLSSLVQDWYEVWEEI